MEQRAQISNEDCPRCIDERLIRVMGKLLVCPNCDLRMIADTNQIEIELPPLPRPPEAA